MVANFGLLHRVALPRREFVTGLNATWRIWREEMAQYMAKKEEPEAWVVTAHPPAYRVLESVTGEPGRLSSRVVWVSNERAAL